MPNHTTPNRRRTSYRELVESVFPALTEAANAAGLKTLTWTLATTPNKLMYIRDGNRNLCDGWASTHDAKVGMQGMTSAFQVMAYQHHLSAH